jgi:hypothetical protein
MPNRNFRVIVVVTGLIGAAALGAGCACEPVTATPLFPAAGATASYGQAPFPSDLFVTGAPGSAGARLGPLPGLEQLAPQETEALRVQLAALDGFGARPVIELPFVGLVDAATVPARTTSTQEALFVVDVEAGTAVPYEWRVVEHSGVRAGTSTIVGAIVRGHVLEEGTLYAAVVTSTVRGVGGALGAAPFDALDTITGATTQRALDAVRALPGDRGARGDVVTLAAFTTGSPTRGLVAARGVLAERAPPQVTFDDDALLFIGDDRLRELLGEPARDDDGEARLGWSFGTGMAHDHVAAVGTATLHGITFRRPDDEELDDMAAGIWAFDDDGAPIVDREVALPVSFAVPKGDMPAGGWPVAFFGHGLGGSRAQMLAFIDSLAREGWATVAIDADGHGLRHTEVDEVSNVAARLGPTFRGVADRRDGFGDVEGNGTAFDLFHGFKNIAAMRDQMRQSVMDLSQVVRAIQGGVDLSPLVPGVQGATLDATRVAYLGESFGGVLGSLFSSVEPDVHFFYLDVPGGGVMDYVATNSPALSGFANLFVPPTFGLDPEERLHRFHPLIGMGSQIFDGADPLTYAPHTLRNRRTVAGRELPARSVIIGCVIGDEILPNGATHALAKAYGMPLLGPSPLAARLADEGMDVITHGPIANNLGEGQTGAMVHFSPANHGDNWSDESGALKFFPFTDDDVEFEALPSPVPTVNPVRATHEQVRRLLRDHAAGVAPTLVVTDIPRADFDNDGVLDDDDVTPFGF